MYRKFSAVFLSSAIIFRKIKATTAVSNLMKVKKNKTCSSISNVTNENILHRIKEIENTVSKSD